MGFLTTIFNTVLYRPLFNALLLLYQYLPGQDFGVAVIVLTVLIRILFYPLGTQAVKAQKSLQELQPKIKEIQEKYKNDREKQVQLMLELYKKEKINPFSGLLPLLVQLPILFALYQVFWRGFQPEHLSLLYSFVPNPGKINPNFLGIINLSKPNIYLAIFAGLSQFFQLKMTPHQKFGERQSQQIKTGKGSQIGATPSVRSGALGEMMQKQMLYFFPAFTILILWNLPSAIGLYWLVSTLFSIVQQYFVFKKI